MTTNRPPLTPQQTSTSKTLGPPLHVTATTLISASALFSGTNPIILGANVIIQLRSRLSSTYGPVDIGEGTIVNERASIGLLAAPQSKKYENETPTDVAGVNIGRSVQIGSGAVVEATSIGAFTIIEAGAIVGKGAVVGERCKICAKVEIGEGCVVEDGIIVWGSRWGQWRAEKRAGQLEGKREGWVKEQAEVLRRNWTGK